jgi:D-amino-acid dehydrogenase
MPSTSTSIPGSRSIPSISHAPHTIIIGAGVIGVATGYFLACRGERVTIIDKGEVASGASFGNAGIIAAGHLPLPRPGLIKQTLKWMLDSGSPLYIPPRFSVDLAAWLWRFHRSCNAAALRRSMDVLAALGHGMVDSFDQIIADERIECEYQRAGWLQICRSDSGMSHAIQEAELLRGLGFDVAVYDAAELHRREPCFVDEVIGGVHYRDSAMADPASFTIGLAKAAARRGAALLTGDGVGRINTEANRFISVSLESGRVIEADTLVLAAGAWTTPLAASIGINVPMQPAKGYHIMLSDVTRRPSTACVLAETFVAVTPLDNGLRLAGTLEFSGLNDRIMRKRVEMLSVGARRYIRDLDLGRPGATWCGLRPCTADGLPVMGWAPQFPAAHGRGGVYIATGHAMMGFALGPITGRLASEAMLDGRSSIDISALRVERFRQRGRRASEPIPITRSA